MLVPYSIRFPTDAFTWNVMIRAFLNAQKPKESVTLYFQMHLQDGVLVDSFSLSLVLKACGRLMDCENGQNVHVHVVKLGFGSDLFVQTALIDMYAKCGCIENAGKVFDCLKEPDLVSYNVLLAEYVRVGEIKLAHKLFNNMPERDLVSWNTIIHGYASLGDAGTTQKMFDITSKQRQQSNEALRLFHDMQLANVEPDKITLISILPACGNVGALGMGKTIHEYIEKNKIDIDMKLGTTLLDMYAKCGDMDNSLRMFECLNEKDIITWSVVIMALANHGFGEFALDYFSKMIFEGFQPNDVTFIGILSACSHIGFVHRGWMYFISMTSVYGVTPKIEHYGCMVDILGRAGRLQEARELIKTMPFALDAIVWRAFLAACRIHKNLAEEATVNHLELEPHEDENYVLLSNIHSQVNNWDQVVNLRRMMKNTNIQQIPGSSPIDVNNAVYEFISGDKSHPKSKDIYEMLDEILDRLKYAGYKPLTTSTIQDFDEQEKRMHWPLIVKGWRLLLGFSQQLLALLSGFLRTCEYVKIVIWPLNLFPTSTIGKSLSWTEIDSTILMRVHALVKTIGETWTWSYLTGNDEFGFWSSSPIFLSHETKKGEDYGISLKY